MSREERAHLPIPKFRLGEEPDDDLFATTTPEERLDMVWRLTLDAWASAGKSMPTYARHEAPGRLIRHCLRGGDER